MIRKDKIINEKDKKKEKRKFKNEKNTPPPQRGELWQNKKTDSPHTFTQVLVLREFFGKSN